MLEQIDLAAIIQKGGLYLIGVAFFVIGALGMSGAISIHIAVSAVAFTVGILIVLAVHEYLGGPV